MQDKGCGRNPTPAKGERYESVDRRNFELSATVWATDDGFVGFCEQVGNGHVEGGGYLL